MYCGFHKNIKQHNIVLQMFLEQSSLHHYIQSIITPVFSVTWSFRNHSNMLISCSRNISHYQCWKLCCAA